MVLSSDEVIAIIESGVPDKIELSRKKAKRINMHVTGLNVVEFLESLDEYETKAQKLLREKLVKSNRSIFSFVLRPLDKVFTAKGGSERYNLPQKDIDFLKSQINEVADGLDIKKYLKKVVKKQFVIDPNGVLFIDIDPDGMLETHVITTEEIYWYENKGNTVKAIIFEPYNKEVTVEDEKMFLAVSEERLQAEKDKLYYRVLDDATDRIFVSDGGKIVEETSSTLDNYFGFVPALILGDDKNPNEDIFESIVADVIEDADALLRQVSVNTIHSLAHLYPRYWSYAQACTRCEGEGTIPGAAIPETDPVQYAESTICASCGGEGNKTRTNPSDETVVTVPQDGDPVLAPNLMGYTSPDLETAKFYINLINNGKQDIFESLWGTGFEQGGKRETATGRWLDQQPVEDRLRDVSETFSKMHQFMLNCYGKVIFRSTTYQSSVSYGTRYILDGADDILKMYIEASRENISEIGILDMRNRYLEAEYQSDPVELMKKQKLANVEPFPTIKVKDVMDMEGVEEQDKLRKLYYSTWLSSLTETQKIVMSKEQLEDSLTTYINSKSIINNGTT